MLIYEILVAIMLFLSLALLGISYFLRRKSLINKKANEIAILGWIIFGIYWVTYVPYFLDISDLVNAGFCALALPFFGYLAYHELLSYKWHDDLKEDNQTLKSLNFMAGAAFVAGTVYFLIDTIPILSGYLIKMVSEQTEFILDRFGYEITAGKIDYNGNGLWFRENKEVIAVSMRHGTNSSISIVLACTAIQSMMIFCGTIFCTKADKKRKWKAFMYTVPVIYELNLIRNVGVIYLSYEKMDMDIAHNWIGKGGSLIALIILAYITFNILPELHENILGLFDLPKRKRGEKITSIDSSKTKSDDERKEEKKEDKIEEKRIDKELIKPSAYPDDPEIVELLQTHISFIFITSNYVYKVKKAVNFGFLDFSTLEKRLFYCNKEVELNKRLSADIYLDVVPVNDEGEKLIIDGNGKIVDYAVKMKKIPMDTVMKKLLEDDKITNEMMERVAKKIADFHKIADNSTEIDEFGKMSMIKTNTDENFEQTMNYIGKSITKEDYDIIKDYTDEFYKNNHNIFEKRIQDKKIRDCHGDLHMEHICFSEPIIIFDCIEFNERFRYSDTAADIAFLAMDLDFHNRIDLSKSLIDSYVKYSDDSGIYNVLNFYKIYRAYVRGKVISFRLDDKYISDEDKSDAIKTARKYFDLAKLYVNQD